MKIIPIALKDHYAGRAHTLARLWRIERLDGEIFGFTDHDQPIEFESLTYSPSSVFDASAIATRGELNVDNLEVQGLIDSDGITTADIEAGRWDGARIEIREVNYKDLTQGANILRVGDLGEIKRSPGAYVAEMRGLMQFLQNNAVKVVAPACNARLGDERCGVDLSLYTQSGSVSAVTDRRQITISVVEDDGYFNYGLITFTDGANAGIGKEIKKQEAGAIDLFEPFPYDIEAGDAFTISPGCNKTHASRLVTDSSGEEVTEWYGDCKDKFDNLVNFRGFPTVPGQDKVLLVGGQK